MPPDERDLSRLQDMVIWSRKAIHILGGRRYEDVLANEEKRLALVRFIEVIGEAGHEVAGEGIPAVGSLARHGRHVQPAHPR